MQSLNFQNSIEWENTIRCSTETDQETIWKKISHLPRDQLKHGENVTKSKFGQTIKPVNLTLQHVKPQVKST